MTRLPSFALFLFLLAVLASHALPAEASCNFVPGTLKEYEGAVGSTDRPFASPGEIVSLGPSSDGCETGPAGDEVLLLFTPPNGPTNAVVLSGDCGTVPAQRLTQCEASLPGANGMNGAASCLPLVVETGDGGEVTGFEFPDTASLIADNPNGDRVLSGPAKIVVTNSAEPLPCQLATNRCAELDGAALAAQGIQLCIDEYFPIDGTCQHAVEFIDSAFPNFTALPRYNDFDALCDTEGVCEGDQDLMGFTTDAEGNILAPINWSGVLVRLDDGEGGIIPIPRLVTGETAIPAFSSEPNSVIEVPGGSFIQSFSPQGHTLPPIFNAFADPDEASFFGSADAPLSVTRIKRRGNAFGVCDDDALRSCNESSDCAAGTCEAAGCYEAASLGDRPVAQGGPACTGDGDCAASQQCGPALFEFRDRFQGEGCGPVEATFAGTADQLVTVDNLFLPQSDDLLIIAHDEPLETLAGLDNVEGQEGAASSDFNGDMDEDDVSLTAASRKSGAPLPLGVNAASGGIAVPRVGVAANRLPAVAAEDDVLALLQYELADFGVDADGNGRVEDAVVRVYRLGEAGPINDPVPADPDTKVAGAPLAVADGLVFYRASEPGLAARKTMLVSVDANGNEGNAPSIDVGAITPHGRFVAFTSDATNLTADSYTTGATHVFVHDRDVDGDGAFDEPGQTLTERVSESTAGTEANENSGDSGGVDITPDGRYVAYTSRADNLVALDSSPIQSIYWHDRVTGTTELASQYKVGATATNFEGPVFDPQLSDDGQLVLLWGRRSLNDIFPNPPASIFLRDRVADDTDPVAVSLLGPGGMPNGTLMELARNPSMTPDGRFVVYEAYPCNPAGGTCPDLGGLAGLKVRDRTFATTFQGIDSFATTDQLGISGADALGPDISADGGVVVFATTGALRSEDTNDTGDVYRWRVATSGSTAEEVDLVTRTLDGTQATLGTSDPSVSRDGRFVSFAGDLDELVGGIPDLVRQVYVYDHVTGAITERSLGDDGLPLTASPTSGGAPGISELASHITWSTAEMLLSSDTNGVGDAHVGGADTADAGADLDGDGAAEDLVLQVYDTLADQVATLGPAAQADVSRGGNAAFVCPDQPGTEGPVCVYQNRGTVTNLGRNATAVALSDEFVAALIAESPTTIETHPVGGGDWTAVDGGTRADEICGVAGELVAFLRPEEGDETGNGSVFGNVGALYNAGTDTLTSLEAPPPLGPGLLPIASCRVGPDVRVCVADPGLSCGADSDCTNGFCTDGGSCRTVGAHCAGDGDCAGGETCASAALFAFEVDEAGLGSFPNTTPCDANGDQDCRDGILFVYDSLTGRLVNSGQELTPCTPEAGCDPNRLYDVGENRVRFLTSECFQQTDFVTSPPPNLAPGCTCFDVDGSFPCNGADLNDNGTSGEILVQEFFVRDAIVNVLGRAENRPGDPLGTPDENLFPTDGGVCIEREVDAGLVVACETSDQCAAGELCSRQLGDPIGTGECVRDRGACIPCVDEGGASIPCVACTDSNDADCTVNPICPGDSRCIPAVLTAASGDFDRDGVPDPAGPPDPFTGRPEGGDNCPTVANPEQLDTDRDRIGDACDGLTCGNGQRELDEECDDGNRVGSDSCANDCTWNFIRIDVDVKVGSDANPVNLNSAVIPVAVLSSDVFSVDELDIDTLCFGERPDDPTSLVCMGDDTEKHGRGHFGDLDDDGDTDVQLHFDTDETGIEACSMEACLTGQTVDGIPVIGCDVILTVPPCDRGGRACGLGAELAFALPPLLWLWRRRRRPQA